VEKEPSSEAKEESVEKPESVAQEISSEESKNEGSSV
jgi:hypothetical protein